MYKYHKQMTLLVIALILLLVVMGYTGNNSNAQNPKKMDFDTGAVISLPVPSFAERAYQDSIAKLKFIRKENDSLKMVRSHNSGKILYLIDKLMKRKARVVKDTVLIPIDSQIIISADDYFITKDTVEIVKTDTVYLLSKNKKGIFDFLKKKQSKN